MRKALGFLTLGFSLIAPLEAYAAPSDFKALVAQLIGFANPIATLLLTLALAYFFFGIIQYIFSAGDEGHKKGREIIIWGIVALFVIICLWSLAKLVQGVIIGNSGGAGSSAAP